MTMHTSDNFGCTVGCIANCLTPCMFDTKKSLTYDITVWKLKVFHLENDKE